MVNRTNKMVQEGFALCAITVIMLTAIAQLAVSPSWTGLVALLLAALLYGIGLHLANQWRVVAIAAGFSIPLALTFGLVQPGGWLIFLLGSWAILSCIVVTRIVLAWLIHRRAALAFRLRILLEDSS